MLCKNCGATVPYGVTECPRCGGKELIETQEQTTAQPSERKSFFRGNYKSHEGKIITGVCAGLGKKNSRNPWLFRVFFIIGGLIPFTSWFVIGFYIGSAIFWKFAD